MPMRMLTVAAITMLMLMVLNDAAADCADGGCGGDVVAVADDGSHHVAADDCDEYEDDGHADVDDPCGNDVNADRAADDGEHDDGYDEQEEEYAHGGDA
eukprot:8869137-Pyramimonas_sp.AAC.1